MESPVFEVRLGSIHSLPLPEEIVKPFLEKGHSRVRIAAYHEGNSISFHGALQGRGTGYFLMFGKQNQKALGVFPNDYFQLQFFEDTSKYGVDMPEEFDAVLESDPEARELFESLTDGRKRGLIYAILRYKSTQTRIDKSLILCENLKRGIRDPRALFRPF
ncbi:MAG: YdeI/OmpD-associated family protein [Eudoraea sp.]|nr:YdeI/OmpD-associated family protein [Eudoraea sp.]NNJ39826.1 YdeI/OmpD-associated family protein [Eudoraea sp.]